MHSILDNLELMISDSQLQSDRTFGSLPLSNGLKLERLETERDVSALAARCTVKAKTRSPKSRLLPVSKVPSMAKAESKLMEPSLDFETSRLEEATQRTKPQYKEPMQNSSCLFTGFAPKDAVSKSISVSQSLGNVHFAAPDMLTCL